MSAAAVDERPGQSPIPEGGPEGGPEAGGWPAPPPEGVSVSTPLITPGGQDLKIEHVSRPLFDLRTRTYIGEAVRVAVRDGQTGELLNAQEIARLSSSSLEVIDLASIEVAESVLQRGEADQKASVVVAPVSLGTLMGSRGRLALLNRIRLAKAQLAPGLLLEVTGLRAGFLPSRLREAVALMRPHCRGVFAETAPLRSAAETLQGSGLRGASLAAADLAREARNDPDPRRLAEAAALVGPQLMISGLRSAKALDMARAIGAHFGVSVRANDTGD